MEFLIKISDQLRSIQEHVQVVQQHENGAEIDSYSLRFSDFIAALTSSMESGVSYESPLLPKNCFKYITRNHSRHEVFIDVSKQKWQIEFQGKRVMVGLPRMIFNYRIESERIVNVKVICVKGTESVQSETEVFYFPLPNVYHSSGEICMGKNVFPKVECLTHLETMHFLFLAAEFGTDYGTMTLTGKSMKELIKDMEDKDFDDDWLVPSKASFNDFFHIGYDK